MSLDLEHLHSLPSVVLLCIEVGICVASLPQMKLTVGSNMVFDLFAVLRFMHREAWEPC